MLGLHLCARDPSSRGKRGPLFITVHGPLTIAASPVVEHRLQMRRLSNCGSRAQLLRGMWDLPRPGPEPVSPALAGRLSTTAPPEKPHSFLLCIIFHNIEGKIAPSPLARQPQRFFIPLLINDMIWISFYCTIWTVSSNKSVPYKQFHHSYWIYVFFFFNFNCLHWDIHMNHL